MPTTKKPATKSTAKRPVAKKAPAKRTTSVRAKKAANSEWAIASGGKYESFKLANEPNFFKVKVTEQTIYWAILGFLILALGVWVITLNDKVQHLYDQIDAQNADSLIAPVKK